MATQRRLKLALIGLGRLGAIRARILAFQQPRIELVAICDTKPGSDEWAAANLPPSIKYYADPEDCMKNGGAEAVLISTPTATHAPLILKGFELGLVSHNSRRSMFEPEGSNIFEARNVREAHCGGCHYDE
jgi:myo-inositol 2-dehydrogenase / D-chiro-inositol 1-dehydrogenase